MTRNFHGKMIVLKYQDRYCLPSFPITHDAVGKFRLTCISSMFQDHPWLAHQIIDTFTYADIRGGCFNARAIAIITAWNKR